MRHSGYHIPRLKCVSIQDLEGMRAILCIEASTSGRGLSYSEAQRSNEQFMHPVKGRPNGVDTRGQIDSMLTQPSRTA